MSEDDFASLHPGPIPLTITVPADSTAQGASWGLQGQLLTISVPVRTLVKDLKDIIANQLKANVSLPSTRCCFIVRSHLTDSYVQASELIPGNKMQLKDAKAGFLKDANSLAAHNINPGSMLELTVRSRGGKR
jgi:hypothetical protein